MNALRITFSLYYTKDTAILCYGFSMPPKRKSGSSARKSQQKRPKTHDHSDVVRDVVEQLTPLIAQSVQNAVAAITDPSIDQPQQEPSISDNDDSDVEIFFNEHSSAKKSQQGEMCTLGLHLSQKIVRDIQGGKYVNLVTLLPSKESSVSLNITQTGSVVVEKVTEIQK